MFFDIYRKCKCQKTPQLSNSNIFLVSYEHLKVLTYSKIILEYLKLTCALSKLVVVVMKVIDYTNCELVHD